MHPQIDEIVRQLVAKKKFVFLCTNAMLLRKKMDKFKPSPYFAWAVHIDGLRERHDESVAKEGVFDEAVAAIKEAKRRGFRVTTNSTFFNTDTPQTIIEVLNYLNDDLKVDEMMLSPAYAYEKAPTRSTSSASSRPGNCSRRPSRAATGAAGGSTRARSSWTSWRARSTSRAPRGRSRATRSSAGRSPAT